MAIPVAFTEARDKLQRTRKQSDSATHGVQRKRYAPMGEVFHLYGKRHMRQQVTKSFQRVYESEEREHEPQEFRKWSHVGYFVTFSRTRGTGCLHGLHCSHVWLRRMRRRFPPTIAALHFFNPILKTAP